MNTVVTHARYALRERWTRIWTKYLADALFVHINKTGGSSVEKALGLPFQHRTALEFIDLVGQDSWNRRFTFSFVRNPWDKVLSHYRFRVKTNQTELGTRTIPFSDWVIRAYGEQDPLYYDQPKMFMAQTGWICDPEGSVLVDFIGRFETLESDFSEVAQRLGRKVELPHLKRSSEGRRSHRESYSGEAAAVIERVFRQDLDVFGYEY